MPARKFVTRCFNCRQHGAMELEEGGSYEQLLKRMQENLKAHERETGHKESSFIEVQDWPTSVEESLA